jgi:hypothetical protein
MKFVVEHESTLLKVKIEKLFDSHLICLEKEKIISSRKENK